MGAWTLIEDYTVPTTTNAVTIDLSATPIQKGEFWRIDYQMISPSANIGYGLYFNGNTTATNYYNQVLQVTGTSIAAFRGSDSYVSDNNNQTYSTQPVYIVLAENGIANYFTNKFTNIGTPSNSVGGFHYNTTTFTMSSITSLTLQSRTANQVGAGSRFRVYKLTAQKVKDITVASNTTQVDLTDLNITKDSEYLLVSDWNAPNAVDAYLYVNDNTTDSNYYFQRILGDNTSASAARANSPRYIDGFGSAHRSMAYTHIKLSNIGAVTSQSYGNQNYGTSGNRLGNYSISTIAENITSITKINIKSGTNGILAGSRFILYKLY